MFSNSKEMDIDYNDDTDTEEIRPRLLSKPKKTTAKAEKEPKTKAKKEPKTKAEKEPKTKAKKEPKTKAEKEPKTKAEKEPKTKAEKEPKTKAEKEPKTKNPVSSITNSDKMDNYKVIDNITLEEQIDTDKLRGLVKYFDRYKDTIGYFCDTKKDYKKIIDEKTRKSILKSRLRNKLNKITYKFSSTKYNGRLFSQTTSLQGINKVIRHTLSQKYYDDVDIVNCHPVILKWLCDCYKIRCENIEYYINNREEIFELHKDSIIDPKTHFLSLINDSRRKIPINGSFEGDFYQEVRAIQDAVAINRPDLFKLAKKNSKNGNENGSCINYQLCEIENKILQCMYNELVKQNIKVGTFCFDGMMVEKDKVCLKALEKCVYDTLNIQIKLSIKPMTLGIKVEEVKEADYIEKTVPQTHEEIGKYLVNKFMTDGNIFYYSKKDLVYIFNETNCLFEESPTQKLMNFISEPIIKLIHSSLEELDPKIDEDLIWNLGLLEKDIKSTPFQKCVLTQILNRIPKSDDFIENNFDKIPHIFPIADNKVINFKTCVVEPRLKTHFFTITTDNVFKSERPNQKVIRDYIGELLKTTNKEYIKSFLILFGYFLTGLNNAKVFPILTGDGDNGKSVFFNLYKKIIGSLGIVGNEKVFLQSKSNSVHTDEYLPLIGKRLAWLTEIDKESLFNEKLIKTITGNDGAISLRSCGGRTVEVVIDCKLFCICNCDDIPTFKDKQGFANRVKVFKFANRFARDPLKEKELYALKDDLFTELCFYTKMFFDEGQNITWCDEINASTNEYKDDMDTIKAFIDENYIITNQPNDRVSKKELLFKYEDFCRSNTLIKVSRNEFYKTLISKYKLEDYRKVDFKGIKAVKNEEDINEEDIIESNSPMNRLLK